MAAAVFVLLLLFLVAGVPIAVSLGLASTLALYYFTTEPMTQIPQKFFNALDSFPLMAIPFFVLSSAFFTTGGVARRLIKFCQAFVGHLPGGLAITGVAACAIFAAVSGSSPATVVAIGSIIMPAMIEYGYPRNYAVGSITNAGSLGILIPPSIPMIVYAVATEESTGKLFMAGVVPGIMLALMLIAVCYVVAKRGNYPLLPRATWAERWRATKEAAWSLLLPVIIIGGIYGGVFTPTEAAGVAVAFGFVVGMFIHREMKWRDLPRVVVEAAKTASMLFFIIAAAMIFAHILTSEQIPQKLAAAVLRYAVQPWMVLLFINALLLLAGDFMEPSSIIMITMPIFYPVIKQLGIDPIHFGVVVTVNMEIGMVTPPVGLNLYVSSAIMRMGLYEVVRAALPWMWVVVVALGLVTYIPQISLWLPNLVMR